MTEDPIRKALYRAIGQLYSWLPALGRNWGARFDALAFEHVPWAPAPNRPLRELRLSIITTGGVHLRSQPGFDMVDPLGDASFRVVPAQTAPADLMITHDYYDHSDAERDMNILFPLQLLQELAERKLIAGLGDSFGFMGHIEPPHVETLIHKTAPQVAGMLKQQRVDAVLLTPA